MAAAALIYGSSSAAIVGATATVRKIVEEKETQVKFAPAPEPEPEPPPPPPVQAAPPKTSPRPKVKRPELAPPDKISEEKLKESDKALAAAGDVGSVGGFLDGTPGGRGTGKAAPPPPPPPKLEPLVGPVDAGGNDKPKYSPVAKRKGIEGTVVVSFEVLEDGRVANAQIVSGPAEFHDIVLRAVASWHFRPAHQGAKNVRFRMKRSIVFRLEDA